MGQLAVCIVQRDFKPRPVFRCIVFKLVEQPVGKDFSNSTHIAVTGKFMQVSMHAYQRKSDGAGRMKILDNSLGLVEKGRAHCEMPGILKKSH